MFCPKVIVAQAYSGVMNRSYRPGRSIAIDQDSDDAERERATKGLADGSIDFLFNVDICTEGYDVPKVARVAWTSPTGSLVRWTQGCGRGFRVDASVAPLLKGGPEDAAERRLLIESSAKPYCEILTYAPANCKHSICTAVDLLGGTELPPEVKRYAEQIQEEASRQAGGSATDEALQTAGVFADLMAAVDTRRREIKAKAVVRDMEFDGMGGGQVTREKRAAKGDPAATRQAASASWGNGEAASEKQLGWYRWKRIPTPPGMTKFQGSVVRDLIEAGVQPATAFAYPKQQALSVRDSIRARKEVAA